MRIIEIIVGSDSEPSQRMSLIGCNDDPVEDNFLVELVLNILVGRPLDDTEAEELSLTLKGKWYNLSLSDVKIISPTWL